MSDNFCNCPRDQERVLAKDILPLPGRVRSSLEVPDPRKWDGQEADIEQQIDIMGMPSGKAEAGERDRS